MHLNNMLNLIFRALLLLSVLCCAYLLSGDPRAVAAPGALALYVNNSADVPDWNPGDGKCETASNNGICTLRAAIMEANAYAGWDTINLQAGATYNLSRPGIDDDAYNGDLDITDKLTLNGAWATVNGGGIDRVFDVPNAYVFVSMNKVTIRNGAASGDGGGLHNKGVLTLTNVIITLNHSSGDGGGAANDGSTAILVLDNSWVTTNVGGLGGGGLFNDVGWMTLENSIVGGNQETFAFGGGIENFYGTVKVLNSTINNNTSKSNGGGISSSGLSSGGALVTLINSTVAYNTAGSNGGGIYDDGGTVDAPAVVNLYNTTIYGNIAVKYSGGGIAINPNFADYVNLWNTLVAGNRQQSSVGPFQDCSGTFNSQDYNLIQTTAGCSLAGFTAHNKINVNPVVGPLQYNGGATPTVALLAGSPAIEGGNLSGCIDEHGAPLSTDQRGYARPTGARCDIGAFEKGAILVTNRIFLPLVRR